MGSGSVKLWEKVVANWGAWVANRTQRGTRLHRLARWAYFMQWRKA